jgi:hypothetical protein
MVISNAANGQANVKALVYVAAFARVMRVDPVIPRCEKCTLVIEAIGDDKVRVNHQSLPSPLVILADQALEIITAGKSLRIARAPRSAEYIDVEPTGLADAGYGPETK